MPRRPDARLLTLAAVAGLLMAALPTSASAQRGVGAQYDTRDPRTCADQSQPKRGAIPAALAMRYFICGAEKESDYQLFLVENVQLQVGAPRRFQMNTDAANDVDPSQPVYPIRGSFVRYQCRAPSALEGNKGKNCSVYQQPKATGACYKTTFGDWNCSMMDIVSDTNVRHRVAPPRS